MAKRCFCVETGIIYDSYADAAEECGYPRSSGSKNWDGNTRIEENFCRISLEIDRLIVGEC